MKKIIIAFIVIIICYFFIQTFFGALRNVNTMAWVITCENRLKNIWQCIEQYKDDWDGSFPQSLSQLALYNSDLLPECPGESWAYCYLTPSDKLIKPLCWDSKTHYHKFDKKPYKRNVLFSDGHIESLREKDFFLLMKKFGISNPDNTFSKYVPSPEMSKNIEPIHHEELIKVLENTDISDIDKLRDAFNKFPIQQQLETIAYTLSHEIYSDKAVRLMTGNRDLLNINFAKYFPDIIRNLEDRALYDAINIVNTVFSPDPAFIPVLLDYAIESDYVASIKTSAHSDHKPIVFSVFITTSRILYRNSDGKIGKQIFPSSQYQDKGDRIQVIKQWRDTYEETIKPDLISKGIISE